MPTVLRERGYQVVIFSNDHPPPHVHVRRAGSVARVGLSPVVILSQDGFNTRQLSAILALVNEHLSLLREKWEEIHGQK